MTGSPLTDKYVKLLSTRDALDSIYVTNNEKFKDILSLIHISSELLDEVVVTGYQTISRERATGSFAKVDSKKLETQRLSSVSSLME